MNHRTLLRAAAILSAAMACGAVAATLSVAAPVHTVIAPNAQALMTVQAYTARGTTTVPRMGDMLRARAAAAGWIVKPMPNSTGEQQAFILVRPHGRPFTAAALGAVVRRAAPVTRILATTIGGPSGRVIPIGFGRRISYLAASHASAARVTLVPGTLTTGTRVDITPSALVGNKMLLQVAMNVTRTDATRTLTAAGAAIALPEQATWTVARAAQVSIGAAWIMVAGTHAHHARILVITPTAIIR